MIVSKLTSVWSFILLGYVCSQPFDEDPKYSWHSGSITTYPKKFSKLSDLPKKFEIRSSSAHQAKTNFEKFANQMHHIAKNANASVLYKVKVQIVPNKKNFKRKMKKGLSKKFNVPLKKNSLRLSQFESILRKVAETNVKHAVRNADISTSTAAAFKGVMSTRQMTLKFKPIPSKLKYSKIIRPVKKRIITLTV